MTLLYPPAHVWLLNDQEYVGPLGGGEALEALSRVYGLDFTRFFQLTDAFELLLSQEYDPAGRRWYFRVDNDDTARKLSLLRRLVLEQPLFFHELFDFFTAEDKWEKLQTFADDVLRNLQMYHHSLQHPFVGKSSVFEWETRRRHPLFLAPTFFGIKDFAEGGVRHRFFARELHRLPRVFDTAIQEIAAAQTTHHQHADDLQVDRALPWASDLVKELYAIYNRRTGLVFWQLTEMSRALNGLRRDLWLLQQRMDRYSAFLRLHALAMGRRTLTGRGHPSPSLVSRLPDDVFQHIVKLLR